MSPEFLSLSPNNKIPAIIDPDGPDGEPLALFESGAILIYLADKTGQFMPTDAAARYETMQWLMFQMGGIGPMFGQVGFFHKFAGRDYRGQAPARPLRRRVEAPARRARPAPAGRAWIMGDDYSIADIATFRGSAIWSASTARANWWASTIPAGQARAAGLQRTAGGQRGLEIPQRV